MTIRPARPFLMQLQKIWNETTESPDWSPTLLYCGPYDDHLKAFPIKSEDDIHFLWIPPECKFGLRFMNHVLYCVWYASRFQALPHIIRCHLGRIGQYTDELRSRFFEEILAHWYPAGTQFPTQAKPNTPSHPLESQYLASFLVLLFHRDTPVPVKVTDVWPILESETLNPVKFNWEEWARRKPANQILFGPSEDTELYRLQLEENRKAGIPNAPSVEIDRSSWTRYASAVNEEYIRLKRDRIDASGNQPSPEHHGNSPTRELDPKILDSKSVKTPGSFDTLAAETSERSRMKPENYSLELNRTQLLFIPPLDHTDGSDYSPGTVVQVCIRGDHGDGDISDVFSVEQASVTQTIETLLVGHVNAFHKLPKCVIIKEAVPGHNLIGVRKPWKYGLGKKFFHGDTTLQPAQDKWIFRFEKAK